MSEFDPGEHTVDEVVAHLEQSDENEIARVLDAEAEGKDRSTIAGWDGNQPKDGQDETEGFVRDPSVDAPKPAPVLTYPKDEPVHEFDATEENAVHLLAGAKKVGLDASVVTTKNSRLQAPESVVKAAEFPTEG